MTIPLNGWNPDSGVRLRCISEMVDLTDLGAKYKAVSVALPAGAVFAGVQAKIAKTVVAGGTTVKVAVGLNAGDVDLYGITPTLLKNAALAGGASGQLIDFGVYQAAPITFDVCGVVTDGSALGDTDISAGLVQVNVYYLEMVAIPDFA